MKIDSIIKACLIIGGSIFFMSALEMPHYKGGECEIKNLAIQGGEKLVYKVYYNWEFIWVPAGEAEFIVSETETEFDVKVNGKTYAGYDPFFRVRDYFHSVIDKKTMHPKYFVRIVEEGNYRKFDSLIFNHASGQAVSFNGTTKWTARRKVIDLDNCTHDVLSVLYFLRNTNVASFKKGDFIPTQILIDEKTYPIKVRYNGKKDNYSIKDLGVYDVLEVVPDLISGKVFKENNQMKIYVSNDNNKVPLLIESPLSVGHAKAVLKSHTGLKHKLIKK